jgi:hypothetical protein
LEEWLFSCTFRKIDPLAARVTRDIDLAVDRRDLARIAEAVRRFGFEYRHSAGVDVLLDAEKPDVRSAPSHHG